MIDINKTHFADERGENFKEIGQSRQRSDSFGHVTGATQFCADRNIAGLLHLRMVRSPHHHARILRIDTSAAERHPGIKRIITAKDVPHNVYTILSLINFGPEDEPVLAFDKVRWLGEPVVAVIADSERSAQQGAALVRVDYEQLPAVFDVEDALKPGAPLVNEYHGQNYYRYDSGESRRVKLGDAEAGFREADYILEERYDLSPVEHAPTETTGCIVVPDQNNRLLCYTGTQAIFFTLDNASIILGMPPQRLHFLGGTAGGGFGGKVDCVVEPITLLAASFTGRPVAFIYNRYEEMQISSPRAAERIYIKDGVMKDGRIVARQVRLGAMKPSTCYAHACAVAEVEVDTETGEVDVLSLKCVYEIGRALNPKMVEQQLVGGAWMGMSHALYETTEPYYPARDHGATDFNEYLMPGLGNLANIEIRVIERPAPDGPYGAKGLGEMCANVPIPAIANAVFDAVGVRIDSLPLTPEKILRALQAKEGAATGI